MKLSNANQLGLRFENISEYKEKTILNHKQVILDNCTTNEEIIDSSNRFMGLISGQDNKFYHLSNKALAVINKIKVDDKLEPKFFANVRAGKKVTVLLGENFYRYHVLPNCIMIISATESIQNGQAYFSYHCFSIFTDERNCFNFPNNSNDPHDDKNFYDFIRILIFLEFSETEEIELKPGKKTGDKYSGKTLNDSNKNVVFVNSRWNHPVS